MSLVPRLFARKTSPKSRPEPRAKGAPAEPKDQVREFVETIVFVLILVLLLKTFVAEAFVIPTGSMAETLLGYQKFTACPKCGHVYPVNSTDEVDPQNGAGPRRIDGGVCPNCQYLDNWSAPGRTPPRWASGDRVIVLKTYEGSVLGRPDRWNVVVFKYPEQPQKHQVAMNYIKRLVGLPGETIAVCDGDLYVHAGLDYPDRDRPESATDLWQKEYMYLNDPAAREAYRRGEFQILRRPLAQMLAMKRIVYDNDRQAEDLIGKVPPRWQSETEIWRPDRPERPQEFRQAADTDGLAWLRYHHLVVRVPRDRNSDRADVYRSAERPLGRRAALTEPDYIRNVLGYNSNYSGPETSSEPAGRDWVGDLLLEWQLEVETARGEFVAELSRGADRFRARIRLDDGICRLSRATAGVEAELASAATAVTKPGRYDLRFANVDQRLTLWVNGALPFGNGVEYPPPSKPGPDPINDKQPASLAVAGTGRVAVRHLKLWRDTYYTRFAEANPAEEFGQPTTRYVQPGHYMVMGDNSTHSSDSRHWGSVPERLMLGRAVFVYYPFLGVGPIGSPVNRVGPIW